MGDLVERLKRYRFQGIHREAADKIEQLERKLEWHDGLRKWMRAEIEWLQAENKRLEDRNG